MGLEIGISGGRHIFGQGDSEGQVRRCRFLGMTVMGLAAGSFNALDWWVMDSEFRNCAVGTGNLTPLGGAGAVHAYRNNFFNSSVADYASVNIAWLTIRDNYSYGSAKFLQVSQRANY